MNWFVLDPRKLVVMGFTPIFSSSYFLTPFWRGLHYWECQCRCAVFGDLTDRAPSPSARGGVVADQIGPHVWEQVRALYPAFVPFLFHFSQKCVVVFVVATFA